jgi:hypothetical protein
MLDRSRGVAKIGCFDSRAADVSKVRQRAQTRCESGGVAHPFETPETGAARCGESFVRVGDSNAFIGRLDAALVMRATVMCRIFVSRCAGCQLRGEAGAARTERLPA